MPTKEKNNEQLATNNQKGKKVCSCCKQEKKMTDFYISYSPLYSIDQRTPICKECCKTSVLNQDGTINYSKFKNLLRQIDRPLYYELLDSAESSVKKENSYLSDEETNLHGYDILSKFFTLIGMRQTRAKSYSESESEGFIFTNNNRSIEEQTKIINKYKSLFGEDTPSSTPITSTSSNTSQLDEVKWTDQDLQNKKYAIEVVGYDPFEDYPEESRKFLFNQLSPYLEDDNNVDDTYKLSQILQIIKNNNQIDMCDKKMALLDPLKDAESVKTLNEIKNKLVQSNDKIAKENEISVKNRSNKDAGKSTLTYLMRDLRQKDFDKAEADYYDQLRGTGTRWAVDMSIKSIMQNGMFDENDKKEIYEMQLELIDKLNQELDEAKEKIRLLTMDNDNLKIELNNLKVGM